MNVDGYYDSLMVFIDRAVQEGLISTDDRRYLLVSEDPEQLVHDLSESVDQIQGDCWNAVPSR